MSDPLRPLRLNALELLRQPGSARVIDAVVPADALDVVHPQLDGDVQVAYRLETRTDGIVVTGAANVRWRGVCRRCLRPLDGVDAVSVEEVYQVEPTDPDAFPIEHNQLDLAPMTRESVLLELAEERLCRDDCEGLCPVCGEDRNERSCGCDLIVRDERWAVLDALRLDD
jgi:DUF177 domain-containing protein